jgi:hypothetical protein
LKLLCGLYRPEVSREGLHVVELSEIILLACNDGLALHFVSGVFLDAS